ncbi:MAG: universal stress protein [Clostridiales bacterium]|nr:universal stress protein [Clostridiales bacterium]MDY4172670.1 universal stress protein [Evtepia sp.]
MKKILLPIDGSPRSLRTIQVVKQTFSPDDTEIAILLVTPVPRPSKLTDENDEVQPPEDHEEITVDPQAAEESRQLLKSFARMLPDHKVEVALRVGTPGPEIIQFAKEGKFDSILMTRSSRGSTQKLGSVSTYIVSNASFITTTVLKDG